MKNSIHTIHFDLLQSQVRLLHKHVWSYDRLRISRRMNFWFYNVLFRLFYFFFILLLDHLRLYFFVCYIFYCQLSYSSLRLIWWYLYLLVWRGTQFYLNIKYTLLILVRDEILWGIPFFWGLLAYTLPQIILYHWFLCQVHSLQ